MHCDTIYRLRSERADGKEVHLRDAENFCVNLKKMRAGNYLIQNFAMYIDMAEGRDPYEDAMELVKIFEEEMRANADCICQVTSAGEIEENARNGKMSALLSLEEGGMCKGEIEKLEAFYRHGARMLTLCWNYENELGYPAAPLFPGQTTQMEPSVLPEAGLPGLKKKGFEFLEAMEAMGMIPDVSHLSDAGFYDVCRVCRKPFVASHSNARSLCGHARNLTDDMLRALGEHGGVAGLNCYPVFLSESPDPGTGLERLAAHALHMANCGGRACVGMGSDFDGFDGESTPNGADQMADLAWTLHRIGFSDGEIDDILYRNVLQLYREVL